MPNAQIVIHFREKGDPRVLRSASRSALQEVSMRHFQDAASRVLPPFIFTRGKPDTSSILPVLRMLTCVTFRSIG